MSGSATSVPNTLTDRYRVERELGRGGSAIVYLARDTTTSRMVAVKVLKPELSQSLSVSRFLREIKLTEGLSHGHIVPILDSGAVDDSPFCVLPYMDGGTLRMRMDREKQMPVRDAIAITRTILDALSYAHERKIVHRDVKPENILFSGGQACLADFGIARALEESGVTTTTTGIVRGTPAYMSPEQASGERDYDGRSDLYSLSCVLYEMIAGIPAFVGPTSQAIVAQRLIHPPRGIRVYRPSVSEELEAVLERALAIAPADRYQTAEELRDALEGAMSGMTVTRASPAILRRRAMIASLVIVTLVASGVTAKTAGWIGATRGDTSTVAVFALAGSPEARESMNGALARWKPLTVLPPPRVDAALDTAEGVSDDDYKRAARKLGAARYVTGRVVSVEGTASVEATLWDINEGRLQQATSVLRTGSTIEGFQSVADRLLLRGVSDDGIAGDRNLPATQLILKGRGLLDQWQLAEAESAFVEAARLDTSSRRADYWIAQTRSFDGKLGTNHWSTNAARAGADSVSLTPDERRLVAALNSLASGDFASACRVYDGIIAADSSSFAGWFGRGECLARDRVVVRDSRVTGGLRFRSSYHRAIEAYRFAFRLRPATFRGFEAESFDRLRRMLYMTSRNPRTGRSLDGPAVYLGFPTIRADTLAFVVTNPGGGPSADDVAQATAYLQRVFTSITSSWANALPSEPHAKLGIAVALEMQGDPAAIDTLMRVERIEVDPTERIRLAVTRAALQLKFGAPDDVRRLEAARSIADSVLRFTRDTGEVAARWLAVAGAIVGRCNETAAALRRVARPIAITATDPPVEIPEFAVADAYALQAYAVLGCRRPSGAPGIDAISANLARRSGNDSTGWRVETVLFGATLRSAFPSDSVWVVRVGRTQRFASSAQTSFLLGDTRGATARLREIAAGRVGHARGELTADVVLPEADLWLRLHDTASAAAVLDDALQDFRFVTPLRAEAAADNVAIIASMIRAMALRGQLGTGEVKQKWTRAAATVWKSADDELRRRFFGGP